MKRIVPVVLGFLAVFAVFSGCFEIGRADADGDGSAMLAPVDAGSAVALPAPANRLHDPVSSPAAAWDDVKAAKKVGWPVLVFALLVMLAKGAARAGKRFAFLATGKTAVVVGALGALGAACYNAAADGGAWTATMMAGLVAIGHYFDAGGKQA